MVLFFGGIIFALFGVWGCVDLVQKKKKYTEETTAIVTEISKEIDNDNNLSYWPIIEYNINGKKFKNKLLSGNSIFQKYNIGNEVEIFYNKENGDEFYCKERYYSSLFWWLITAIIGGVLMILPFFKNFEEDGESPLARHAEWINTTCPHCGKPAKRETDTMPQWAGSSWYFLRYTDPHNHDALASKEALEYWSPVDWYNIKTKFCSKFIISCIMSRNSHNSTCTVR